MDAIFKIVPALALIGYALMHLAIWRAQERDSKQ